MDNFVFSPDTKVQELSDRLWNEMDVEVLIQRDMGHLDGMAKEGDARSLLTVLFCHVPHIMDELQNNPLDLSF